MGHQPTGYFPHEETCDEPLSACVEPRSRLSLSLQARPKTGQAVSLDVARRECSIDIDLDEPYLVMRLHLADQIHIGGYHRAEHKVTAARDRITMQNNGLGTGGHLHRTVGVAAVNDIRWI
jgi:hypothetical protein